MTTKPKNDAQKKVVAEPEKVKVERLSDIDEGIVRVKQGTKEVTRREAKWC